MAPCDAWRVPWESDDFDEVYDGAIEVRQARPHLCGAQTVLFIITAPNVRHDMVVLVAVVAALRALYTQKPQRAFLVHSNGAALYEVDCKLDDRALVEAVLGRKLSA